MPKIWHGNNCNYTLTTRYPSCIHHSLTGILSQGPPFRATHGLFVLVIFVFAHPTQAKQAINNATKIMRDIEINIDKCDDNNFYKIYYLIKVNIFTMCRHENY